MNKRSFPFLSIILSICGVGLTFLSLIWWFLGFIGLAICIISLIFSICSKKDSSYKQISYFVSVATLIISVLVLVNFICKEFLSTSFTHNGATYNYDDASLSLIIFIFMIGVFVWDKLPMATTAILGCSLMVIFGLCSFSTAFGQFASSTVILTIGVMIIGAAISETGLAKVIGKWIIKISKNSHYLKHLKKLKKIVLKIVII
mgnify:CR=1 FL=1